MIIINGELHYCYRSAHGMDLGLIPRNESDFVNLLSGDSMEVRNKLKNFVGLEYISACDYCNGARKSVEVRATQHAPGQKATEVAPLEAKVFFAPRQPSGEK